MQEENQEWCWGSQVKKCAKEEEVNNVLNALLRQVRHRLRTDPWIYNVEIISDHDKIVSLKFQEKKLEGCKDCEEGI